MIRFIHVGDQVNEGAYEFAFFDTVTDSFMSFQGEQLFESAEELLLVCDGTDLKRILGLIPERYFYGVAK